LKKLNKLTPAKAAPHEKLAKIMTIKATTNPIIPNMVKKFLNVFETKTHRPFVPTLAA